MDMRLQIMDAAQRTFAQLQGKQGDYLQFFKDYIKAFKPANEAQRRALMELDAKNQ